MANAFSRSWEITKLSFDVMKKDKELFAFPILSGIFSLIFVIAMLFPTVIVSLIHNVQPSFVSGGMFYLTIFIIYFGLAFISIFFNVCVVYTVKKRFEGGNSTFGEAIGFAFSRIHLIFSWSIISATVGLILRILDNLAERLGLIGELVMKILVSILGMIWTLLTLFVIPSMVYYNIGPIAAIKKSTEALKKTWGESLIRIYGLGIIQFVFIILGILFAIGLFVALSAIGLGLTGILITLLLAVIYFVAIIVFFSVANTIFNTALFVYAETGKIPMGYNEEVLKGAFGKKEEKKGLF